MSRKSERVKHPHSGRTAVSAFAYHRSRSAGDKDHTYIDADADCGSRREAEGSLRNLGRCMVGSNNGQHTV